MASLFDKIPAPLKDRPKFTLRDYQRECIESGFNAFNSGYRKNLFVLPTGTGKTCIFNVMAERVVNHFNQQAMIIVNREELLNQSCDKLFDITGLDPQIERAKSRADTDAPIIVSSIQSLCNRYKKYKPDQFGLIVLDEAHLTLSSTYMRTMEYFKGSNIAGFTATPDRGDKKNLCAFYENIAYSSNLYDMIYKRGWLVPIQTISMPIEAEITKDMSKGSDLSISGGVDQEKAHSAIEPFLKEVVDHYLEMAHDRKTLAFLPLIKTAKMFADIFNEKCRKRYKLKAEYIHGKDPQRKEKLEAFSENKFNVLANSDLLSYGYDEPTVNCLLNLKPTKSRPAFMQRAGRIVRPWPTLLDGIEDSELRKILIADSPKENALIIDPLYSQEELSLVKAPCLIAQSEEESQAMIKKIIESSKGAVAGGGSPEQLDLFELQKEADHMLEESLRKKLEARKKKKKSVIDPVEFCLDLGNILLADYKPIQKWESDPVSESQKEILIKNKVDIDEVLSKGHASKIIDVIMNRKELGLSTPNQVRVLKNQKKYLETLSSKGLESNPIKMTYEEAHGHIDWIANNIWRRR